MTLITLHNVEHNEPQGVIVLKDEHSQPHDLNSKIEQVVEFGYDIPNYNFQSLIKSNLLESEFIKDIIAKHVSINRNDGFSVCDLISKRTTKTVAEGFKIGTALKIYHTKGGRDTVSMRDRVTGVISDYCEAFYFGEKYVGIPVNILHPEYQMNIENCRVSGEVTLKLLDKDMNIKSEITHHNLVVAIGRRWMIKRLLADGAVQVGYMGVGTGTANTLDTMQALVTQLETRVSLTSSPSQQTTTTEGDTIQFNATIPSGTHGGITVDVAAPITEAGLFLSPTTSDMVSRITFPQVNKMLADTLQIEWKLRLASV